VRASALRLQERAGDLTMHGVVELAEISGSDTYVHLASPMGSLVAQVPGVHYFDLGQPVALYVQPGQLYVFGADGALLHAPIRRGI
jgi:glycerol transport system ATP-binding protein